MLGYWQTFSHGFIGKTVRLCRHYGIRYAKVSKKQNLLTATCEISLVRCLATFRMGLLCAISTFIPIKS